MGVLDRFRSTPTPTVPLTEHAAVVNDLEVLTDTVAESIATLDQLAREDVGWAKLGAAQAQEFTRAGLLNIQAACVAAGIKSPLLGRGLRIRRNYVWGLGMEVTARETTSEGGNAEVNDLIQGFIDSPEYARTLGSAQAREERENDLGTRGEFFVVAIHDRAARTVRPRRIPAAQITDYVHNPDDQDDVWFYRRDWTENRVDLTTGQYRVQVRTEWHPALDYRPVLRDRVDLIGMKPVRWDQPIQHRAVNAVTNAPWGIPDLYAALDWSKAYADYLGAWHGLMKALARYAFKVTAPAKQTAKVRQALANGAGPDPLTGRAERDAGATAVFDPSATMAPMHSSGATIDAGSGKPLAGMAAAALDVPLTMLLADPGTSGARAVAETLDRPLELTTGARQALWVDWEKALFQHVITVAVEDGMLNGVIVQSPTRQLALLAEDVDATVDVTFPPIEQQTPAERMEAVTAAANLRVLPPLMIARMTLEAIGVEDIDQALNDLTDDDGNFVDPEVAAAIARVKAERDGAPGSQAVEVYQ